MKRLSWILTLPLMAVAVIFAVANRSLVTLDLWPLALTLQAPLFVLVLGSTVAGLFAGAVVAWFSGGSTRRQARAAHRRTAELKREVAQLREVIENERTAAEPPPPVREMPGLPAPNHTASGGGSRTIL